MKKAFVILFAASLALAGLSATEAKAGEQKEKKQAAAKQDRWSGTIVRSNKEAGTLTVAKGNVEKTVVHSSNTKWTKGTGSADMSEFKDGSRVICLGHYDEKGRLVADRIDLRPPY